MINTFKEEFALTCKNCGSHDVIVFQPQMESISDPIIPFVCRNCGEENEQRCKIKGLSSDGILQFEPLDDRNLEPKLLLFP